MAGVTAMPGNAPAGEAESQTDRCTTEARPDPSPAEGGPMMLTFVYAAGAAALLGLPADYTWCRAGSWPHSPRLSLRPPYSALSPWPPALACCTAPGPSPPDLRAHRRRRRRGRRRVPALRDGSGATPGRFSELWKAQASKAGVAAHTSLRRGSGRPNICLALGHCSDAGQAKSADAESAKHFPLIRSRSTGLGGPGLPAG